MLGKMGVGTLVPLQQPTVNFLYIPEVGSKNVDVTQSLCVLVVVEIE